MVSVYNLIASRYSPFWQAKLASLIFSMSFSLLVDNLDRVLNRDEKHDSASDSKPNYKNKQIIS